jgi:cytochrome P450
VILTLLGMPESDFAFMLKLTQELFGQNDEEMQRDANPDAFMAVIMDMFAYFTKLTASRREHPTEDLASAIANATINGEPLTDMDTLSYYAIVASAGHDTTSAGITGGLLALIQNPEQLARLQADPSLMGTAVEEIIRCVVPVKEFMRTAQADTEVRGVPIKKGESVLLSYVSANRDEDVFKDPMKFDVGRDPNKHLAFGYGVHFCLGASLARMEINSFFTELIPRIKSIELAGEPELISTLFVGGLKRLPIRITLK